MCCVVMVTHGVYIEIEFVIVSFLQILAHVENVQKKIIANNNKCFHDSIGNFTCDIKK